MKASKILILVLLILVSGCSILKKPAKEYKTSLISLAELKQFGWFREEYKNYKIAEKVADSLTVIKNFKIIIVGGEWCSDTRLQLPRFIKLLESMNFPSENLKIIFVNREKQLPKDYENLQIKFVPTFIIFDNANNELGRIIETPVKSLEKDLLGIILKSGNKIQQF